jgi:hypothetical protein
MADEFRGDYTPTSDVFGRFIEGLKFGRELKKDEAAKAEKALTDKYASDERAAKQRMQDITISQMSGGAISSGAAFDRALREVEQFGAQQPTKPLSDFGGAPAMPVAPGTEGISIKNVPTRATPLGPNIMSGAGVQAPEEQAKLFANVSGESTPMIEQYQKGLQNISKAMTFAPTGYTPTGQPIFSNYKDMKLGTAPKADSATKYGWGYGQTLPQDAVDRIVLGIHQGTADFNKVSQRHANQIQAAWERKYGASRKDGQPPESIVEYRGASGALANTQMNKAVRTIDSVLKGNEQGDPSLLDEMEEVHSRLDMRKASELGVFTRAANKATAWWKEQSGNPDFIAFNTLKASLGAEISSALSAGGVPTDMRMEVELANIQPDVPHEAFKKVMATTRSVLQARRDFFSSSMTPGAKERAKEEMNKLKGIIETSLPGAKVKIGTGAVSKTSTAATSTTTASGNDPFSFEEFSKGR